MHDAEPQAIGKDLLRQGHLEARLIAKARRVAAEMQLQYQMDEPLIGGLAPDADDLVQEIGLIQRHGALVGPGDLRKGRIDAETRVPRGGGVT
jgi:hypothetical protein